MISYFFFFPVNWDKGEFEFYSFCGVECGATARPRPWPQVNCLSMSLCPFNYTLTHKHFRIFSPPYNVSNHNLRVWEQMDDLR